MTNHAVKAPVNKHAELGFMPPFHSARTVCLDLGAFLLSLARLSREVFFPSRNSY